MSILNPGFSQDSFSAIENTSSSALGVRASDAQSNLTTLSASPESGFARRAASAGTGLQAQYYQGKDFSNLKHTRTDATVDFNWGRSAPDASLEADDFSVRWLGQVWSNSSEEYTFYTYADDRVRLWVDGQLLIDRWSDHSAIEDQGTIFLTADQPHDIRLDYYENTVDAIVQLLWSSPSQAKTIIPQSQLDAIVPQAADNIPSSENPQDDMIPSDLNTPPTPPPQIVQAPASSDPRPEAPTASVSAMSKDSITTTVDWNNGKGTSTSLGYGLNAFQGFRPESFRSASYKSNMSTMNPGLIRFHNSSALQDSSTPDGLIDTARKSWDADKVKSALAASFSAFGENQPQRMINIPTWPDWMDADRDGFLDRNQFDNYAQLCADLVKVVNKDSQFNVKYWEVTNEKDDHYFTQFHENSGWGGLKDSSKPDRLDELITIYNKAAVAMKQADPTISVGGPGIARADLQPFYVPFIKGTASNLDFFTYHFYATGSASTADQDVFNATHAIGDYTSTIVQALRTASPNRIIPAMLGEYNISWTWETRDPRMTNHKGVVFDALSMVRALSNGAAATLAWNEKDGVYGKMDDQGNLRLSGDFLQLLNRYMVGEHVATTTSKESAVTTFAVSNRDLGYKSYLIVNQSENPQQVQMNFTGWNPTQSTLETYTVSSAGYSKKTVNWADIASGIAVPGNSVILLTFPG